MVNTISLVWHVVLRNPLTLSCQTYLHDTWFVLLCPNKALMKKAGVGLDHSSVTALLGKLGYCLHHWCVYTFTRE